MGDSDWAVKLPGIVLIVLVLLAGYRLFHPPTTFAADGVSTDWDSAVQRGHDAGEPTLVLFTAEWCPACQWLHSQVLSRGDVRDELNRHYNVFTVNMTRPTHADEIHARNCRVGGYPQLIRYDVDGHETARTYAMDADSMIEWLKAGE